MLAQREGFLGHEGEVNDIFPFVQPWMRGKGVASALYAEAERLGYPVEALSDQNAFAGNQTALGSAVWQKRKFKQGKTADEILDFLEEGRWRAGGETRGRHGGSRRAGRAGSFGGASEGRAPYGRRPRSTR